jgi:hypothetical protein
MYMYKSRVRSRTRMVEKITKFILKTRAMYKVFDFDRKGNLAINFNGSKILLTKEGDIHINAKRHIIYKRKLSFNGCSDTFIKETTEAYEKGNHKDYLRKSNLERELKEEVKCHGRYQSS